MSRETLDQDGQLDTCTLLLSSGISEAANFKFNHETFKENYNDSVEKWAQTIKAQNPGITEEDNEEFIVYLSIEDYEFSPTSVGVPQYVFNFELNGSPSLLVPCDKNSGRVQNVTLFFTLSDDPNIQGFNVSIMGSMLMSVMPNLSYNNANAIISDLFAKALNADNHMTEKVYNGVKCQMGLSVPRSMFVVSPAF